MSPVGDEPAALRATGDTLLDAILDYGAACDAAGRADALGDVEVAGTASAESARHFARIVGLRDQERAAARRAARSRGGRERNTPADRRWEPPGDAALGE